MHEAPKKNVGIFILIFIFVIRFSILRGGEGSSEKLFSYVK